MPKALLPYQQASETLTLPQKVGQLFMPAVFINDSEEEVQQMEALIQQHHVGALCFFHSRASAATNFEGKKKVVHNEKSYERLKLLIKRYQQAAQHPLLIAIDAEWGLAMRIENTPQYPYALTLGATKEEEHLIYQVGKNIGLDCLSAGVHWNLAPVVDINDNPENPVIGYRSFRDDKTEVVARASAYIKGMAHVGVLNAIKHFPGHGDTATDSHLGLPVIDKPLETLMENELYPFQKLIQKGVDAVMVGHLLLPQVDAKEPATTSSKIVTDLLRNTLGFDGVIISDALNMHAVSKKYERKGLLEAAALNAGMDMMCFSEHVGEAIEAILAATTPARIEKSFQRIWKLKEKAFRTGKTQEHLTDPTELNNTLAQNSITECYVSPRTVQHIKASEFLNISFANKVSNTFSRQLEKKYGSPLVEVAKDPRLLQKIQATPRPKIFALFPPAVKPKDQFGFEPNMIASLKRIINQENTLTYIFGNPYVLHALGWEGKTNVVLIYQDLPEFQKQAYEHFRGDLIAVGKLPVTLKPTLQ